MQTIEKINNCMKKEIIMKQKISKVLVLMILVCIVSVPFHANAETNDYPIRTINVVYDDSGSMINTNGSSVDTWCQAKYAMEVFSAMLEENDTMNIFCMSDFENGITAGPKLSLKGSDGTSANVNKVHSMVTRAGNTPFNAVKAAYNNLLTSSADEKWLVVLTDGEFQGINNIDDYFSSKSKDVNVMFLGMGTNADGIKSDENNNIYFEKAENSKEILNKITEISTRIFNSNKLVVDSSKKTIEFDVPMSELTVFAQGANVSIGSITDVNSKEYKSSSQPVTVKYSETATTSDGYKNILIDKNLVGSVVTFKDDFVAGNYTLDISGAETIEVYYKPNIEISASLKDKDGNEVTDLTDLEAGTYTIDFYFVKGGTEEKVPTSKLLGDVQYSAIVTNNGIMRDKTYSSGDVIEIEEGDLEISVEARYLNYNTVSTDLSYKVFKNKSIVFEKISSPTYNIKTNSIENANEPIQYKVTIDGKEFSDEQWEQFETPTINVTSEQKAELGDFIVEKSSDKGVINIYPTLKDGKTSSGIYGDLQFELSSKTQSGIELWTGKLSDTANFNDQRSWFEQNKDTIIKCIVAGVVLFLILGYIPPFKKYLPKSLKNRPKIECKFKDYSLGNQTAKGKCIKDTFSTICPYRAQRGTIVYAPSGSGRAPALKVRAKNSNRMVITNQNAFKDREDITFNGSVLTPSKKAKEIGAGVVITYTTPKVTYTCIPKIK